jgi:hypothetical protein
MADPQISVNLVVTAQGAQPTSPVNLWANLITLVAQINSGYSILPGGLIEDLASTGTYALALIDSACVELINSLSPYTANPWLLVQLGNIYGVQQGTDTNGNVYVVFESNTPGFQMGPGWLVSDGNNQYQVVDGTVINSDGSSDATYCLALQSGIFPIPANSVNQTVTQPPAGSGITVTVNNPTAGTPSGGAQTEYQYRSQVLAAGLVSGQGNASMAKTLLANVPGVQPRTLSVQLFSGVGWQVIVGGGDPYAIANAIEQAGLDLSTLVGSETIITAATKANPAVLTTNIAHDFTNGETGVVISGATGMTALNGTWTVTVISAFTFSIALDTTSAPTYTGGGTVTPNSGAARTVTVDLNSYPDTYAVPFVVPPAQVVEIALTYNTVSPNIVAESAVQQLGAPPIANYLNSLPTSAPINTNAMGAVFTAAILPLLNGNIGLLSELSWTVSISGFDVSPVSDTFLIYGDKQGFFTCSAGAVTITQA